MIFYLHIDRILLFEISTMKCINYCTTYYKCTMVTCDTTAIQDIKGQRITDFDIFIDCIALVDFAVFLMNEADFQKFVQIYNNVGKLDWNFELLRCRCSIIKQTRFLAAKKITIFNDFIFAGYGNSNANSSLFLKAKPCSVPIGL